MSVPALNIFSLEVTDDGEESQVPRSVSVYSDKREAASRAWRGKRGYWWYHFEYTRAHGTCIFPIMRGALKTKNTTGLSDGNEQLTFFDVGRAFIVPGEEACGRSNGWYLEVLLIHVGCPGNNCVLTAISVFPCETILLNITKISSLSSSLAGLDFGPTRRKWSWFGKDYGKLLTGARKFV